MSLYLKCNEFFYASLNMFFFVVAFSLKYVLKKRKLKKNILFYAIYKNKKCRYFIAILFSLEIMYCIKYRTSKINLQHKLCKTLFVSI